MANQFLRPTSDVSAGDWTATPLYAKIDEVTADTADFIQSVNFNNKPAAATSTCEVSLGSGTDPSSSINHTIRYKAMETTTSGMMDLTVSLKQGATVIASWAENGLSNAWTDFYHTLSGAQADAITDYSALSVEFVVDNNDKQKVNRYVQVAWLEFETPAVGVPLQSTVTITASQTSALTLGAPESLASTVTVVVSSTSDLTITKPLQELESAVTSECTTVAGLTLGASETLASTVTVTATSSGGLALGASEALASTVMVSVIAVSNLTLGASETLASTVTVSVTSSGELSFGSSKELESVVTVTTDTSTPLSFVGQTESIESSVSSLITASSTIIVQRGLIATVTSTISSISALDFGGSKSLESSLNVTTLSEVPLIILRGLLGTISVTSDSISDLSIVGGSKTLEATVLSSVVTNAILTLGVMESLQANIIVTSMAISTLGNLISLFGTVSAESTCSIDLSFFGENKPLSGNVSIVTAISGALSFGANEGLEGALLATTLAIGALSFGAPESLQTTVLIASDTSGSLSFVQYLECTIYVEATINSDATAIRGLNAEALTEVTLDSALSVSYGLFANPAILTTIGIPSVEYAYAPILPLTHVNWPNAVMQSSMYNSEIERIYTLLSSLKQGELVYGSHFRVEYDETNDALAFYYNDTLIMRLNSQGDLEIAGTLYESAL